MLGFRTVDRGVRCRCNQKSLEERTIPKPATGTAVSEDFSLGTTTSLSRSATISSLRYLQCFLVSGVVFLDNGHLPLRSPRCASQHICHRFFSPQGCSLLLIFCCAFLQRYSVSRANTGRARKLRVVVTAHDVRVWSHGNRCVSKRNSEPSVTFIARRKSCMCFALTA